MTPEVTISRKKKDQIFYYFEPRKKGSARGFKKKPFRFLESTYSNPLKKVWI